MGRSSPCRHFKRGPARAYLCCHVSQLSVPTKPDIRMLRPELCLQVSESYYCRRYSQCPRRVHWKMCSCGYGTGSRKAANRDLSFPTSAINDHLTFLPPRLLGRGGLLFV